MPPHRPPTRALVMVWDGMRPDLVSPELTPHLAALGQAGTVFDACHAVVPTVTRVNAATLASGAPPAAHGLPANVVFAPAVDTRAPLSLGEGETVAALRAAYGLFGAQTVADIVHAAGGRTAIVSSGTRGSAQMLHPRRCEAGDLILHPTLSTTEELAPFVARLGPLPEAGVPDTARNRWLAEAAASLLRAPDRPDLLLFWHDDPDKSQHRFGLGHPASLEAIRDADRHLGLLLAALDEAGVRDETLVVVVSDHGYVGVERRVDLAAALGPAVEDERVILAPNGCAVLVYVERRDARAVARVAARLDGVPGLGAVFSGADGAPVVDGTAPLDALGIGGPLAPDLLVTLDWRDDPNEHGYAGVSAECGSPNLASHGGASRWEVRNTLVLGGPGVRAGQRVAAPAGNADLAPTILAALGLPIPPTATGRVLSEALERLPATPGGEVVRSVETVASGRAEVVLAWSAYGGRRYLGSARRLA